MQKEKKLIFKRIVGAPTYGRIRADSSLGKIDKRQNQDLTSLPKIWNFRKNIRRTNVRSAGQIPRWATLMKNKVHKFKLLAQNIHSPAWPLIKTDLKTFNQYAIQVFSTSNKNKKQKLGMKERYHSLVPVFFAEI